MKAFLWILSLLGALLMLALSCAYMWTQPIAAVLAFLGCLFFASVLLYLEKITV